LLRFATFLVWQRNVALADTSVRVRFRDRFANHLTTNSLVACGVLHRREIAEIVNNIPYLLF
jgi:hypothetical protein